jgi:hypothetical protein
MVDPLIVIYFAVVNKYGIDADMTKRLLEGMIGVLNVHYDEFLSIFWNRFCVFGS